MTQRKYPDKPPLAKKAGPEPERRLTFYLPAEWHRRFQTVCINANENMATALRRLVVEDTVWREDHK
jgi:hypothetical protein